MSDRSFQMRLLCRYEDPDNTVGHLRVENLEEGEWRNLDLNTRSPGFLIFVYAVFTCQHVYFRANCAERGLMLESAEGAIDVVTTEDWALTTLHVHLKGKLKSGTPSSGDIDYIVSRMTQCPVSRNTREPPDSQTIVEFS